MAKTETASEAGQYLERMLDNRYVQERLVEAAENLRAAYRRASKRRVEPTNDKKLRRQVRSARLSLTEAAKAAKALKTERKKPKRRKVRRALMFLGIGAFAAAAALAASEDLRKKLFTRNSRPARADDGVPKAAPPEGAVADS
jgi:hypothetical protein